MADWKDILDPSERASYDAEMKARAAVKPPEPVTPPADLSINLNIPGAPPQEAPKAPAVGASMNEVGRALVGGIFEGVNEAKNTLVDVAEVGVKALGGDTKDYQAARNWSLPTIAENETTLGGITRSIVKFAGAAVGAGKFVKGGKAVQLAAGAVSDYLVAAPEVDGMLIDMATEVPVLGPIIEDALGSNTSDPRWLAKAKVAVEGVVIGAMVNGVVHLIAGKVKAAKLRDAGDVDGARRVDAETAKIAEEDLMKASASPDARLTVEAAEEAQMKLPLADGTVPTPKVEKIPEQLPFEWLSAGAKKADDGVPVPPKMDAGPAGAQAEKEVGKQPPIRQHLSPEESKVVNEMIAKGDAGKSPLVPEWMPTQNSPYNTKTWDSPESLKHNFDQMVGLVHDTLKNTDPTRVIKHEQIAELAEMSGTNAMNVKAWLNANAKTPGDQLEHLSMFYNAKKLLQTLQMDMEKDVKLMKAGLKDAALDVPGAEASILLKQNAILQFADQLAGIQGTAARMTSAGQMRTIGDVTAEGLERLHTAAGSPQAIIASLRVGTATKWMAAHNFYWVNSVLSGPVTQIANGLGNLFMMSYLPAARIAGGVLTGDAQQVETGLRTYAAMSHTIMDSIKMMSKSLRENAQFLDPASPSHGINRMNPLAKGEFQIPTYLGDDTTRSAIAQGVDYIGQVIGAPTRLLSAVDEFFKQINYRSIIMAEAQVEGFKQGKQGAELAAYVKTIMDQSVDLTGKALYDKELARALEGTFTNSMKVESWGDWKSMGMTIQEAGRDHPILSNLIFPFVRVPINLARAALDMTPLAPIRKQFWHDIGVDPISMKFDISTTTPERRATALGKMGLGTMFATGMMMLAQRGYVTGGEDSDPALRETKNDANWKPYSYVLHHADGTKTYIPMRRLDPVGLVMGMAADAVKLWGKHDGDLKEFAAAYTMTLMKNYTTGAYMRSLADVITLLQEGTSERAVDAFTKFSARRLASYVPSAMGLIQPDDTLKHTRGLLDAALAKLPGLSSTVEAKRDNFGQKYRAPQGYPYSKINPFAWSTQKDPVRTEMGRLAETDSASTFATPPEKYEGRIDLTAIKNTKTGQTAYDRWMELHGTLEIGGNTLHQELAELIKSDEYKDAVKDMKNGDKVYRDNLPTTLIKQQIQIYRKEALLQVAEEMPALMKALEGDKENAVNGKFEGPASLIPIPGVKRRRTK